MTVGVETEQSLKVCGRLSQGNIVLKQVFDGLELGTWDVGLGASLERNSWRRAMFFEGAQQIPTQGPNPRQPRDSKVIS